ncbi:hypothetical protein NSA24_10495 [Clostridioides mangenotii]|uniref:hypothetical protein n=1 Tax=Metaclostridioides mangenotii TaxID=1540 RepID=UPI00214A31EC|nr:hypothetical protein [Clostridioides mangenotii]MCR1955221.1 hypothetical protein [Clostridioides mangenotii]
MIKGLDLLVEKLKELYPVFGLNIKEDEVLKNPSFFIYNDDGEIRKGEKGYFITNFYLYFFTKDDATLNQIEIIKLCRKHGLIFENTQLEYGKFNDTDVECSMRIFTFHHLDRIGLE